MFFVQGNVDVARRIISKFNGALDGNIIDLLYSKYIKNPKSLFCNKNLLSKFFFEEFAQLKEFNIKNLLRRKSTSNGKENHYSVSSNS